MKRHSQYNELQQIRYLSESSPEKTQSTVRSAGNCHKFSLGYMLSLLAELDATTERIAHLCELTSED
jgi:sensor histidine kinase YesM